MINLSPKIFSKISSYDDVDLGPHAKALWGDLRGSAEAGLPLGVIVLAAALVDVVHNEKAGPAGYLDKAVFTFAGNKASLAWLRNKRNIILHHDRLADGLMGEVEGKCWLLKDAERAITTVVDFLVDLRINE